MSAGACPPAWAACALVSPASAPPACLAPLASTAFVAVVARLHLGVSVAPASPGSQVPAFLAPLALAAFVAPLARLRLPDWGS